MLFQYINTAKRHNGAHNLAAQRKVTLGQKGQKPILSILQHRARLVPARLLESTQAPPHCHSTETHHAPFTFVAKCVTHAVHRPTLLSDCSAPSHDGTVVAQRVGRDRPVKEERQTLMSGAQQEQLSSGLQQQDAIWAKSRRLPEINAIPSLPISL